MKDFSNNIFPFEKFQFKLMLNKKKSISILKNIKLEEFKDNSIFSNKRSATYSIRKSSSRLLISREVHYMNFMKPVGIIIIDKKSSTINLTIIPFLPGIMFLFGLLILPIVMLCKSDYIINDLSSLLIGLLLFSGFFSFGYFFALVAFKMESSQMRKDIVTYLVENKLIENNLE